MLFCSELVQEAAAALQNNRTPTAQTVCLKDCQSTKMLAENFHQNNMWGSLHSGVRSYSFNRNDFQLSCAVAVQNIVLLAFTIKCYGSYYS